MKAAVNFVLEQKQLLRKATVTFDLFGWLLHFAKAKAGLKAQLKGALVHD